jgi:Flp pilus assembly protein TadD
VLRKLPLVALLALAGCSITPFQPDTGASSGRGAGAGGANSPGAGPVVTVPAEEAPQPPPEAVIEAPPSATTPIPREPRPRTAPPAELKPASRSLVQQAQAQRKKGDLAGATVSLDRALHIEPSNPLLWIEMGRLRMDQHNYPQAENMGRKALSMSVGDSRTQAAAWQLIGDSFRARGKNPQAQAAYDKSAELSSL